MPGYCQLPETRLRLLADDVKLAVVAFQFEIPVIRSRPSVEDLFDEDLALVNRDRTRRLFATIVGVALDLEHGFI